MTRQSVICVSRTISSRLKRRRGASRALSVPEGPSAPDATPRLATRRSAKARVNTYLITSVWPVRVDRYARSTSPVPLQGTTRRAMIHRATCATRTFTCLMNQRASPARSGRRNRSVTATSIRARRLRAMRIITFQICSASRVLTATAERRAIVRTVATRLAKSARARTTSTKAGGALSARMATSAHSSRSLRTLRTPDTHPASRRATRATSITPSCGTRSRTASSAKNAPKATRKTPTPRSRLARCDVLRAPMGTTSRWTRAPNNWRVSRARLARFRHRTMRTTSAPATRRLACQRFARLTSTSLRRRASRVLKVTCER